MNKYENNNEKYYNFDSIKSARFIDKLIEYEKIKLKKIKFENEKDINTENYYNYNKKFESINDKKYSKIKKVKSNGYLIENEKLDSSLDEKIKAGILKITSKKPTLTEEFTDLEDAFVKESPTEYSPKYPTYYKGIDNEKYYNDKRESEFEEYMYFGIIIFILFLIIIILKNLLIVKSKKVDTKTTKSSINEVLFGFKENFNIDQQLSCLTLLKFLAIQTNNIQNKIKREIRFNYILKSSKFSSNKLDDFIINNGYELIKKRIISLNENQKDILLLQVFDIFYSAGYPTQLELNEGFQILNEFAGIDKTRINIFLNKTINKLYKNNTYVNY